MMYSGKVFAWAFFGVLTLVTSQEMSHNTSSSDDGVQELLIPMCRNLVPYNLTKLPNSFGHTTQRQVYRAIEHLWAYMDNGCSTNFRLLVCATYLPKYDPETRETIKPCRHVCIRARRGCMKNMRDTRSRWPRAIRCNAYERRGNCMRPNRERRGEAELPYCIDNTIPLCASVPYEQGYLPNFYLQHDINVVRTELQYYNRLLDSRCSVHLPFFLCGAYMPFCTHAHLQTPCRELCEQVFADCGSVHRSLYRGLPWPNKLQCHRFFASDSNRSCAMPGDV